MRLNSQPPLLRAADWSGTPTGIAVITILSIIGFLLLVALLAGSVVLIWFANKGFKEYRSVSRA